MVRVGADNDDILMQQMLGCVQARRWHTARHGNSLLTGLNYVAITTQWSGLGLTMMTSLCNRCLAVYKLVVGTQLGMVTLH